MVRLFDIVISAMVLILLSPVFLILAAIIATTSPGGVFYRSERIGKSGEAFKLIKFRSMVAEADRLGTINVAGNDTRVTKIGRFLRTTKLDELPQFINVLRGQMMLVGPRPDLKYYTDMYEEKERLILNMKPGMTDWGSLANFEQYEGFAQAEDADGYFIKYVRPLKVVLQLYYAENRSLYMDVQILILTLMRCLNLPCILPKEVSIIVNNHQKKVGKSDGRSS